MSRSPMKPELDANPEHEHASVTATDLPFGCWLVVALAFVLALLGLVLLLLDNDLLCVCLLR